MVMGMSYEDFWYGDTIKAVFYRNAFIEKQRLENKNAWELGAYVREAVLSSMSKKHKYPKKPFDTEIKTDFEVQHEQEIERKKAIEQFERMRIAWIKAYGGK